MKSAIFDLTVSNLIPREWWQHQFLGNAATHFPYFHLLIRPLK